MPDSNPPRPFPGRFNLFDLFIAALVITLAMLAYTRLTAPQRMAPPYALDGNRAVMAVDLQLPVDQPWACELAVAGIADIDARTGEPTMEILGCTLDGPYPVVSLRVYAVRAEGGRLLFEGAPLVPGRELRLEAETLILVGTVRRVKPEAP